MGINAAGEDGNISLSLSESFRKLALLLSENIIKDFTLTRTTMGEVFTDFAKFQINAAAGVDQDADITQEFIRGSDRK